MTYKIYPAKEKLKGVDPYIEAIEIHDIPNWRDDENAIALVWVIECEGKKLCYCDTQEDALFVTDLLENGV